MVVDKVNYDDKVEYELLVVEDYELNIQFVIDLNELFLAPLLFVCYMHKTKKFKISKLNKHSKMC